MLNPVYWLRHPQLIAARIRYLLWERRHPELPWLCPEAVEFCQQHLTRQMSGLEFGSGRSTVWFAKHLGRLTSIEHHEGWHGQVQEALKKEGCTNVDYHLIALDHPESEGERAQYDPLPKYVAVLDSFKDESLDFVVVDGHYRSTCIRTVPPKIKPGGLLLVDDLNLWYAQNGPSVPADWMLVSRSSNGIKETGIWRKPRT